MDIYVLVLSVAAIVMLSFKKLGQPLVLGYLVAGFLVSPHMDYMQVLGITPVIEREIEDTGQIGVMVIMFCLGLEFSFKKLGSMGKAPFVTSFVAILAMMLLGYFVGMAMGFGEMDCIFLGGMLSMSSTAIIYKAFDELGLSSKSFTSRVMSVLILEDILGVVLLVLLGAIGRGVDDMGEIMGTVIGLAEFVGISLVVGLVFIPWFMRKIRNISNPEVLLMLSIAFMLLLAKTSAYLGFSTALGAFIMGSILSETYEAHKIEHSIQPIKNYLGAVFFVSVGMLVDVQTVVEYWVPIVVLTLTVILGQAVFGTFAYALGSMSVKDAFRSGFSMAQVGEFSFIIASLGVGIITPSGSSAISGYLYPVIVAVSVITTFFTPYMMRAAEPAYNLFAKLVPPSFINMMEERAKPRHGSHKKKTLLARMFDGLFAHAKLQNGNYPRYAGTDVTASMHIVTEGDMFDGRTAKTANSLEHCPFIAVGYAVHGNDHSWVDITPGHVFRAGDRIWVVEKTAESIELVSAQ